MRLPSTALCSEPHAKGEGHIRTQKSLKPGSAHRRAGCWLWQRGRCPGRATTRPSHPPGLLGQEERVDLARKGCGEMSPVPDLTSRPAGRQAGRQRCGTCWGCEGGPGQRPPSSPGSLLWVHPAWAQAALLRGPLSSLSYSATHWQAQAHGCEAPGPSLPPRPSPRMARLSLIICTCTKSQVGFHLTPPS